MAKTSSTCAFPEKKLAKQLIAAARKATKNSYAPYSGINVGAALYCSNGCIYTGTNIENSSYSLSMCAERTALFKAVSDGEKTFVLLLLYSPQIEHITPCGACLQVLSELAPGITIASMNANEEFRILPLKTLIPEPFSLAQDRQARRV
jgi:cytidine deaminase